MSTADLDQRDRLGQQPLRLTPYTDCIEPDPIKRHIRHLDAKLAAVSHAAKHAINDLRIEAKILFETGTAPGGSWHDPQIANRHDELLACAALLEECINL